MIVEFTKALVGLPLLVALALNQGIVYSPVQAQYDEAMAAAVSAGIPGLLLKLEAVANSFPGTPYAARAAEIIQVAALLYPGSVPNQAARLEALKAQAAASPSLARVAKRIDLLRAYYAAAVEGRPEAALASLDDPVFEGSAAALAARADAAFRMRDYSKAQALGYQSIENEPRSPLLAPTFVMLGLVECYRGNAPAAARLFHRSAAVSPLPTLYGNTQEYLAAVRRFARPVAGSVAELYDEVRFTRLPAPGLKEPQALLFHDGRFMLVDRDGILLVSTEGKVLETKPASRVEDIAAAPNGKLYYLTREALDLGSGTLAPVSVILGAKTQALRKLRSIAVDSRGDVYLLDEDAGLFRAAPTGGAVKWVLLAPVRGHLVRVDRRGYIYVLGIDHRSIQVLGRDGKPLTSIAPSPAAGKEVEVAYFALNALNHLFVLDGNGSSVQVFAVNDTAAGLEKPKLATLQLDARNPQQKNLKVVAVSSRGEVVLIGKNEDNWVSFF